MEINPDPEKQRCEGIVKATGAAGAEAGAKVIFNQGLYTVLVFNSHNI